MSPVRTRRTDRGFSLVELLIVVAISGVLMGMAVIQIGASRASMNADNGMRHVMAELNRARDMAVAQRRNMEVTFPGTANEIVLSRIEVPATTTTVLRRTYMEGNMRFLLPAGTPGTLDTPDAFGAATALDFDGTGRVIFNTDGMLVDAVGTVINGTVFIAAPNERTVARAVTVLGSTGRVRAYRRLKTVWGRV